MSEIVQTLFGVSPESYQRQQSADADQRAMQYAKLKPFERASYNINRGAYGLAGAIGGALGGQDPELQKRSQRQALLGMIDPTNPESYAQAIQAALQNGDTEAAYALRGEMMKVKQQAQQAEDATMKRQDYLTERGLGMQARGATNLANELVGQLQNADGSINPDVLSRLQSFQQGRDLLKTLVPGTTTVSEGQTIYQNPTLPGQTFKPLITGAKKPVPDPRFGDEAERYAKSMFQGKTYAQLTPEQAEVVNKRVEEEGGRKAAAGAAKLVMPGDKALVDIPAFRAKVQDTIGPQLKTINATDQALQAIEDSLSTGNFASYRAAQVQFARAISGAGDLSQRELKAAGADPSLLGGTADYLSSLFTSTPTTDTQNKIKTTLEAIRKVAAKKSSTEVEQQRKMALRSPGYNPDAVTEALTFPELSPRGVAPQYATNRQTKERIMSTDGGKTWTPVR